LADSEKSERPTPKRRADARREGRVAKSTELNSAFVLLGVFGAFISFGPAMLGRFEGILQTGLARISTPDAVEFGIGGIASWALTSIALTAAPIVLVVALVGIASNVAQVGFKITPLALKPSFKKLNPKNHLKRMFGKNGIVEALKALLKTALIGLVATLAVWPQIPELASIVGLPPDALLHRIATTVGGIIAKVGAAFLLVAGADYAWQRRQHEQQLRMTRAEARQEARQQDLAPELKSAIRKRQLEKARRRMLAEVPTADVVVVNPTHYAVALRYDGSKPAPEVVAKGADLLALAIRRVAEEHGVPIVHNAPLARALYKEVELGRMIPEEFFVMVAEVLAFVFRTAGRRMSLKRRERRSINRSRAILASPSSHGG